MWHLAQRLVPLPCLVILVAGCDRTQVAQVPHLDLRQVATILESFPSGTSGDHLSMNYTWDDWGAAITLVWIATGKRPAIDNAVAQSKADSFPGPSVSYYTQVILGHYSGGSLDSSDPRGLFRASPVFLSDIEANREQIIPFSRSILARVLAARDGVEVILLEDVYSSIALLRRLGEPLETEQAIGVKELVSSRIVQYEGQVGIVNLFGDISRQRVSIEETVFALLILKLINCSDLVEERSAMQNTVTKVTLEKGGSVLEGSPLLQLAGLALLHDLE